MKDGIRLVCHGSATPASDLVPKAIAMVDRLREVDEYAYQQWQVSPNQRIDVKLNGTHATVWIWEGEGDGAACPLYVSGMTWDGVLLRRTDPDTGQSSKATRWFQPSEAYRKRTGLPSGWQTIDAMNVGVNPYATTPFYFPSNGPNYWRQEGWAQIATLHACSYSGTMRQVVQVLLGMDSVVPYRYDAYCTHGIWTHSAKGKRKDWLLEISAARGVLAMPLSACHSTVPKESVLGYVPTGRTFPDGAALEAGIKDGSVRRLLAAKDLEPFYSKSPIFGRCGWAYSASGRKACNIATSPDSLTLNGVNCPLPRMSLFVIDIQPDNNGEPTTATMAMQESGIAIGGGGGGALKGQIRYPSDDTTSVSFSPALPSEPLIDYASAEAPLYCWYSNEEMQVVRMSTSPKSTKRPPDENPKPRYPGNAAYPLPDGPMHANIYWVINGPGAIGQEFIEYPEVANATVRPNRGMSSPALSMSSDIEYSGARKKYYAEATAFSIIETGSMSLGTNTYMPAAVARVTSSTSNGQTKLNFDCVVVPPVEREGVAHYRYTSETEAGPIDSRIDSYKMYFRSGLYEAPSTTDWEASPLTINYELKQLLGGTLPYSYLPIYSVDVFGMVLRSSSAGYGGNYGDTMPPSIFPFVVGETATDTMAEVVSMFSHLLPLSGTESSSLPRTTVRASATFVGSGGVVVPLELDATDMSTSNPSPKWVRSNPEPDGTLHAFMCMRSADGKKYHISPNIDQYGWGCSNFGNYVAPPETSRNWTINFVGDA